MVVVVVVVVGVVVALGHEDHRRHDGVDDERLRRSQAAGVHDFVADPEALAVRMEFVPLLAEVEIEDVPAKSLSRLRDDRRRVADVGAAVDRDLLTAAGARVGNGVGQTVEPVREKPATLLWIPSAAAISVFLRPSAVSNTIRDRSANACALLRRRVQDSNRARSSALSSTGQARRKA